MIQKPLEGPPSPDSVMYFLIKRELSFRREMAGNL